MKIIINSNKSFIVCSLLIMLIFNINLTKSDAQPPPQNPYKFAKDIKHSLFREKDVPQRMSISEEGVPPTPDQQ